MPCTVIPVVGIVCQARRIECVTPTVGHRKLMRNLFARVSGTNARFVRLVASATDALCKTSAKTHATAWQRHVAKEFWTCRSFALRYAQTYVICALSFTVLMGSSKFKRSHEIHSCHQAIAKEILHRCYSSYHCKVLRTLPLFARLLCTCSYFPVQNNNPGASKQRWELQTAFGIPRRACWTRFCPWLQEWANNTNY